MKSHLLSLAKKSTPALLAASLLCNPAQAAVFTVTNTDDDGAGSFRQAITNANTTPNVVVPDQITFAIPGSGPFIISPHSALPALTEAVTIDGYSQTGASQSTDILNADDAKILIVLDGKHAGSAAGLLVNADGCTIQGLAIGRFKFSASGALADGSGIAIQGASNTIIQGNFIGTDATGTGPRGNHADGILVTDGTNTQIGGTLPNQRNVICANTGGIDLEGDTSATTVQGNFIGVDAGGIKRLGNTFNGVGLGELNPQFAPPSNASGLMVGGTAVGAGNLVCGSQYGVDLFRGGSDQTVQGNYIGTNFAGDKHLGNGVGVFMDARTILIGGTDAAARNVISGNVGDGIQIFSDGHTIQGNLIGLAPDAATPLPNGLGIYVDASFILIGGTDTKGANTITANRTAGVLVLASKDDQGSIYNPENVGILGNSIFANKKLGIDLAPLHRKNKVTANDNLDADSGPNGLQNFPVLTSAQLSVGMLTVTGTLNSTASTTFRVEFFTNAKKDKSGFGEGQTFVGSVDVTTDSSGTGTINSAFAVSGTGSAFVTATATDPESNTSEFSKALPIQTGL
jgi:hypothetical protein